MKFHTWRGSLLAAGTLTGAGEHRFGGIHANDPHPLMRQRKPYPARATAHVQNRAAKPLDKLLIGWEVVQRANGLRIVIAHQHLIGVRGHPCLAYANPLALAK